VKLYFHSSIRLHGTVLNFLSLGITYLCQVSVESLEFLSLISLGRINNFVGVALRKIERVSSCLVFN
jgi:hypothetical protein